MCFFGIGRETVAGPPQVAEPVFYRVIPMGSDVCIDCDEIKPHAELEWAGFEDREMDCEAPPLYRCLGGCS